MIKQLETPTKGKRTRQGVKHKNKTRLSGSAKIGIFNRGRGWLIICNLNCGAPRLSVYMKHFLQSLFAVRCEKLLFEKYLEILEILTFAVLMAFKMKY